MASDNQANYARIGGFIIVGIALIVATLVWFGGVSGKDSEFLVETYFPNDVTGLDVGSTVNFRGVRMGSVKRISFVVRWVKRKLLRWKSKRKFSFMVAKR